MRDGIWKMGLLEKGFWCEIYVIIHREKSIDQRLALNFLKLRRTLVISLAYKRSFIMFSS